MRKKIQGPGGPACHLLHGSVHASFKPCGCRDFQICQELGIVARDSNADQALVPLGLGQLNVLDGATQCGGQLLGHLVIGQQLWSQHAVVAVVRLRVGDGPECDRGDVNGAHEGNLPLAAGRVDLALISNDIARSLIGEVFCGLN